MSATNGTTAPESKRRTILQNDVALLEQLQAMSQDGPITFRELPPEMKLALLPSANSRLLKHKLVSITYDMDTYAPLTVTVNDDVVAKFTDDIVAAYDPKIINRRVATGEPALRKPRSVLADDKYRIAILALGNPRRQDTLGFINWEWAYKDIDGKSVADYLNKPQDAESRVMQTTKGKWYDGPSTTYLYEDIDKKWIGVYDNTLAGDPVYLSMSEIEQLMADHQSARQAAKATETETETETEQVAA